MKMDKLKYIMMALVCGLFTACMDGDYDEGAQSDDAPYGNNDITETNLLTIQELKTKYSKVLNTDYRDGTSYQKVEKTTQIKGYVTGNDITGSQFHFFRSIFGHETFTIFVFELSTFSSDSFCY